MAALNASQPKTVVEQNAKDAKLKEMNGKMNEKVQKENAAAKEAIANSDTKKDKDVVLLKLKK